MPHLAARLGFVHRTLWQRDAIYRWAALLGPPPVLGCALAAIALAGWQHARHAPAEAGTQAPWAHWTSPVARSDQPIAEAPTADLPKQDAAGRFTGFEPGWLGQVFAMSVDATMGVNVLASPIAGLRVDGPTIPLATIVDAGPPSGLFVGAVRGLFVVRTPGSYALSARLSWAGTQSANCAVRFSTARHALLRNVTLNVASQAVLNFHATEFRLEPGLLMLQAMVGCWRGDRTGGPGTLTILVRRPGERDTTPIGALEVIHPLSR